MTFSRRLKQVLMVCRSSRWSRRSPALEAGRRRGGGGVGGSLSWRTSFCSYAGQPENALELHRRKLFLWFSHLPREETQFGGYLNPESMQVEPLILERRPEDQAGLLGSSLHGRNPLGPSVSLEQFFEPAQDRGQGVNVVLYGAVGTGKSTVFRKLVLDWCSGKSLSHFSLLIPFSCEDLAQLAKAASLRDLVSRKYHHLRKHPFLSGEGGHAQQVLFLFNGMEKIKLDFRIGGAELCSDPNEALAPSVVVVNLLRKYLLPEASVLVTTRLSAVDRIPHKYVGHYAQICGFMDPDQQREYFASRLLQQDNKTEANSEASRLVEQLFSSLQRESQLSAACFLPSYCWLTCATLHFLRFTDPMAPIRTLTGIYTSFLRLNFGGEVLSTWTGTSSTTQEHQQSLMLYVVQTVGKLAFDGVTNKRTSFSEKELEQWIGGKLKTDEDLHQLAVFRTDVLDFFLAPCVESHKHFRENPSEPDERWYVFAVPAMQEYLAALYVVLGENKSPLEKLTQQVSATIGKANEDVNTLATILSKFIPLRMFAFFNLLKLFPKLYQKIKDSNKGKIARIMATEMFRREDSFNEDVLDQVEHSLLGVHGPEPEQYRRGQPFELYPIFMGGLLHYGNRVLLQHLGCTIHGNSVSQITRVLRKFLVRELSKPQPPEEQMDLLVLLYEFQNPRLTAEVLASVRTIRLSNIRMTPLKCFILGSVLSCTPASYHLEELDLSSSLLSPDLLHILRPAFRHTQRLNLCENSSLLECGILALMGALSENQCLTHLFLLHTGLRDQGALELARELEQQQQWPLQELNVAFNDLTETGAVVLLEACRNLPTFHTVHLYLNQVWEVDLSGHLSSRNIRVLSSVLEGSEVSENWNLVLSRIQENTSPRNQERVKQQLKVFLQDLQVGRQQRRSWLKKLHFFWVETSVHQLLKKLQEEN